MRSSEKIKRKTFSLYTPLTLRQKRPTGELGNENYKFLFAHFFIRFSISLVTTFLDYYLVWKWTFVKWNLKKKNYKKAGPWSEVDDLLLLLCMGLLLLLPKGVEEGNNSTERLHHHHHHSSPFSSSSCNSGRDLAVLALCQKKTTFLSSLFREKKQNSRTTQSPFVPSFFACCPFDDYMTTLLLLRIAVITRYHSDDYIFICISLCRNDVEDQTTLEDKKLISSNFTLEISLVTTFLIRRPSNPLRAETSDQTDS